MNKTDEQLANEAKVAFDQSVDGLDAATLSRLNKARQKALAESRHPYRDWLRWAPATAAVAAVVVVMTTLEGPGDVDVTAVPATDLEILLSEESIEMIEDLEFYAWLDTDDDG